MQSGSSGAGKISCAWFSSDGYLLDFWRGRGSGETLLSYPRTMGRRSRTLRQPEFRHYRVSRRWHVDQAPPPGLVGPRRNHRHTASARRLPRAGHGLRGDAWLQFHQALRIGQGVGDSSAHLQVLSVRFDFSSLYGLRSEIEGKIFTGRGENRRGYLPDSGGAGASVVGASGSEAEAADFLRGKV